MDTRKPRKRHVLTLDSCPSIDIRAWHRERLIEPGTAFEKPLTAPKTDNLPYAWIDVKVSAGADAITLRYPHLDLERGTLGPATEIEIGLTWTAPVGNVHRPWFLCPGLSEPCNRRVAELYVLFKRPLCRHCLGFRYRSERAKPFEQVIARLYKIRKRLGDDATLFTPIEKPKGMHWRTFNRRMDEYNQLNGQGLVALALSW